ncbi:hypothetical protein [[Mycobacterium] nativiensis]|uniref:Alanine and proline rich membrane protein n=1 Tax=[Mycobacterium] nativiensis TaxID=2855503 RepID=A0ABU5XQJ9_9MYCO|nr:hypothetical protein [Mycolicibacter sp. MYC340]MEB3030255.1 hypothetical protein [Mycolicibacter sp. MYC340]
MADQAQPDSAEAAKQDHPSEYAGTAKPRPDKAPVSSGRRSLLAAAAIGLVAGAVGGLAVAGVWHPAAGASGKYSEQQVADAKSDVCAAALVARQAVAKNMHLINPDPENPIGQLAVAANARLSLTGGAAYLRGRLADSPAAPQDVADAARAMAGALEHLNVSYLVGQPNSEHEQLGRDLDSRIADMGQVCG